MHYIAAFALCVIMSAASFLRAQVDKSPNPENSIVAEGGIAHGNAKRDSRDQQKEAEREYRKAMKAASANNMLEAMHRLEVASNLAETYKAPLAMIRQRVVSEDLQLGKLATLEGRPLDAIARFQEALEIDPQNEFARQQLQASMSTPVRIPVVDFTDKNFEETKLEPSKARQTFHISGSAAAVITQVCAAYGIKTSIDESVKGKYVQLDLDRASWTFASRVVMRMTKAFWVPLSGKEIVVVADSEPNRRRYERSFLRTFYLPDSLGSQSLNDIVSALRTMLDVRMITADITTNSISVRAGSETMKFVSQLLQELLDRQPQVMLDVQVYHVSSSFLRSFGVNLPTQVQISYIPSSGAASAMAETLAGLHLSTRGFALTTPSASVTASEARSQARTLDAATLRSAQGQPAVLTLGQRYPIVFSNYSSVVNTGAVQLPIPNFTYVDIGFNLRSTPYVHRDGTVGLQLSIQLSAIGAQVLPGMPEILNSAYSGYVTTMDGEPIVVAGNLMQSSSKTNSGWAGLAAVPGLGPLFSTRSKQRNDDQLLVVIVPHILTPTPQL